MVKKKLTSRTREVNLKNRLTSIVSLIKQGFSPAQIAKKWNVSKPYISKLIRPLKAKGVIKRIGYGVWKVKKKLTKFSLGTRKVNLHALQINFPIIQGKITSKDWIIREKLRNWLPKYKNLDILGGLTLKNNNNKSITVFVKTRDLTNLEELDQLAYKIRAFVPAYFRKEGIILDHYNCKVSNLNIATEDKHSEGMLRKGERFELGLGKKSEKIFEKDNINAKAWIDGSPFKFTAETNDKEWKRFYLQMPFLIRDLFYIQQNLVKSMTVQTIILKGINKKLGDNH